LQKTLPISRVGHSECLLQCGVCCRAWSKKGYAPGIECGQALGGCGLIQIVELRLTRQHPAIYVESPRSKGFEAESGREAVHNQALCAHHQSI
jgi:hypothetical protein